MMHWFIWKGKNSLRDFGIWIGKLPGIVRAEERHEDIQIPGRAGSLTLKEGEDVYEDMLRECTILTRNTNPKLDDLKDWLTGASDLIFSNELDYVYEAQVLGEVRLDRISNDLLQGKIPFICAPLRKARAEETITMTASGTITNSGNVASKPKVSITASGEKTITIGGTSMTLKNLSGTVVVDCDAGIITQNGAIWTEEVTGDFWRIPKGQSTVTLPESTTVEIEPRWRWK